MHFKVDENLHEDVAHLFRNNGHDAMSVWEEGLQGSEDRSLSEICQTEGRIIITMDLDFANIRAYPPANYPGLIVLRLVHQTRAYVLQVMNRVLDMLTKENVDGALWIVEEHQIRVRRSDPIAPT